MISRAVVLSASLIVVPQATGAQQPIEIPRALEIQLAESALPDYLRAEATIYVYQPGEGMVVEREGTNGFHAMVSRVEPAVFRGDWAYTEHPDDILLPVAFDAGGVEGPMRPFLDAARLLAEGASPAELDAEMRRRFDAQVYPPARRSGVAFMLAPLMRAYPDPTHRNLAMTINLPHRMFYAPFVTNDDIGGNPRSPSQPYVIQSGVHGYIGQRASAAEVSAINEEFSALLEEFCSLNATWCLER